ncbi:MAG: helix-turn-helix transcriptional regulator [Pseudomonadota bacterium]|nr:helix-turn-helix transcriptional regulator [Pseudomonadota bacterium]
MPPRKDLDLAASIGARMRALRRARGLSQEAVAERAGLQPETISRAETGHRAPSLPTLAAIALGLGCSVGDIVGGPGIEPLPALTDEEQRLLNGWRRLRPRAREHLLGLIGDIVGEHPDVGPQP